MEKQKLCERFEIEDQGEVHFCFGISIKRNKGQCMIIIDLKAYLMQVLKRFGMADCKPVSTPMESGK